MGFQIVVMFIDSFVYDVTYVRDVEVCMYNMICYIPGCIGSENFEFGSMHDDYVILFKVKDILRPFLGLIFTELKNEHLYKMKFFVSNFNTNKKFGHC